MRLAGTLARICHFLGCSFMGDEITVSASRMLLIRQTRFDPVSGCADRPFGRHIEICPAIILHRCLESAQKGSLEPFNGAFIVVGHLAGSYNLFSGCREDSHGQS